VKYGVIRRVAKKSSGRLGRIENSRNRKGVGASRSVVVIAGAKPARYPGFIAPCDPTLRERVPEGAQWLHEIKIDGYRAQVHIHAGRVRVYSRSGYNWTAQFHRIAKAAEALRNRDLIIDGEATVLGKTGLPDFQALRRELARKDSGPLTYLAFDLLYLNGYDLRGAPLVDRKRALEEVLARAPSTLTAAEYFDDGHGETILRHACRLGLEGIVSKRRDAPYRSGRQESWIKLKCTKSDTFPIVAFVEKLGARPRRIASLYLGRHEGDRLVYAGKARSGYTHEIARELRERLDPLIVKKSPLAEPVKKPKATWVEPLVDAEIEYGGITDDGLLREAVFKGLRDDLAAPRVHVPRAAERARQGRGGVPRENILQLLPDAVVPTKEELAAYWHKVAPQALRYLARRPLKLVRHTRGITFYHKGPLPPVPDSVHQLRIEKREGGEGVRVWIDSAEGFDGLVEMGVVEVHPWAATVDDIELADTLVLDLDPGEGVAWDFVIETALRARRLLHGEGLAPWPKLTGGKGLHLMVALAPKLTHDAAHAYGRRLAQQLAATDPECYVTSAALAKRPGRLFIDFLRNGRGTTAVGAYSPRALADFPVAGPVSWRAVERGIRPDRYTIYHPPAALK
jgi:bifunctional non-homologous end joining protein LigD